MRHLAPVTRPAAPARAQQGRTTPLESLILLIFGVYFATWDNGPTVIQNLSKYFAKTP